MGSRQFMNNFQYNYIKLYIIKYIMLKESLHFKYFKIEPIS